MEVLHAACWYWPHSIQIKTPLTLLIPFILKLNRFDPAAFKKGFFLIIGEAHMEAAITIFAKIILYAIDYTESTLETHLVKT